MEIGPQTILLGLGSVGVFGALALFLPKILGRSKKRELLDSFKKDEKQKKLQDDIKVASKEQEVIAAQVRASENASEETKQKIKKKLQKAAVEIQQTLKEDNLSAIDQQIEDDWEDI